MFFTTQDTKFEAEVVNGLRVAMRELGDFSWEEALDTETATFTDVEWVLTNLDEIDNGSPERFWYYNTFEDQNEKFAEWVEAWFGPLWAKVALEVEW